MTAVNFRDFFRQDGVDVSSPLGMIRLELRSFTVALQQQVKGLEGALRVL
jgi:hypothetical protein